MKNRYSFEEKKKYIGIAAACILTIIAGVIYISNRGDISGDASAVYSEVVPTQGTYNEDVEHVSSNEGSIVPDSDYMGDTGNGSICVHVCGAVKDPGVYELGVDSRIADAVRAAGGFTDKASKNYLNLAAVVTDGQKITVPTKAETRNGGTDGNNSLTGNAADNGQGDSPGSAPGNKGTAVNINTAGIEELMTIPGVGESKAESIIEYRQKNGNFKCKEDIMNITGIKEGVFSKISDYIVAY